MSGFSIIVPFGDLGDLLLVVGLDEKLPNIDVPDDDIILPYCIADP